jgi:hypothetical protein
MCFNAAIQACKMNERFVLSGEPSGLIGDFDKKPRTLDKSSDEDKKKPKKKPRI